MILHYARLRRYPRVFRALTGLTVSEFDDLEAEVLPRQAEAERRRLQEGRPQRQREMGGGGR